MIYYLKIIFSLSPLNKWGAYSGEETSHCQLALGAHQTHCSSDFATSHWVPNKTRSHTCCSSPLCICPLRPSFWECLTHFPWLLLFFLVQMRCFLSRQPPPRIPQSKLDEFSLIWAPKWHNSAISQVHLPYVCWINNEWASEYLVL